MHETSTRRPSRALDRKLRHTSRVATRVPDGIEDPCRRISSLSGAGAIGGLFAAALSSVAEVTALDANAEHVDAIQRALASRVERA